MRNLNFATKALIISLLFLAPVALLSYFFISDQVQQIQFSEKERSGVAAFRHFLPVYTSLLKTRNAALASSGGFDGDSRYKAGRSQTDQALAAFDRYLAESGDVLTVRADYSKLKSDWDATASFTGGASDSARAVFDQVTASMLSIQNRIADNSNLALDPELDTFYLINSLILSLPQLTEDVGQLWGWGTYGMTRSGLAIAAAKHYAVAVAGVEAGLKANNAYLKRASEFNPTLNGKIDFSILDEVDVFLKFSENPDVLFTQEGLTPLKFYEMGEGAAMRLQSIYDKSLPALDALLADRVSTMTHRLQWISGGVTAIFLLCAYFFYSFFLVTRGGLRLISQHLQEMATGDLRRPPSEPWGRDEPATVIVDLRKAYDSLHLLINKVRHSSQSLHSASDEIATASLDLSARTEATAASLEEQAAAIEQIGATVSETAQRAQMAAAFAADNANVAEKGEQVFSQVVSTMRDIHSSSSKINDIISVIDGIAFQTNILALNAAVEAARAGAQGRGFAVVATEVRSLAGRSATAAKEIKALITSSVEQVKGGARSVEEARGAMGQVVANARQINVFLGDISVAAREQAAGVEQVGQSIQVLDRNTQQNAALVEQTTAASGGLRQQAEDLQDEIANFKVI